jgi:hypothetical protein
MDLLDKAFAAFLVLSAVVIMAWAVSVGVSQ